MHDDLMRLRIKRKLRDQLANRLKVHYLMNR